MVTVQNGNEPHNTAAGTPAASLARTDSGNILDMPPASPLPSTPGSALGKPVTVYLIGGYARYKCPFVWLRSPSQRLVSSDMESPLKLSTTDRWPKAPSSVKVWDIIAELVDMTTRPVPVNPFEIDEEYFLSLDPFDRCLATAASVNFLRKLFIANYVFADAVLEDLRVLLQWHFEDVPAVIPVRARTDADDAEADTP